MFVFGCGDFAVVQHPNMGSDIINIRHVSVCRCAWWCGTAGGDCAAWFAFSILVSSVDESNDDESLKVSGAWFWLQNLFGEGYLLVVHV